MAENEIKYITVHPCTATYNAICTGVKVNASAKIEFRISVVENISTKKETITLQMYVDGVEAVKQTVNATILMLVLLNQINICAISNLIGEDAE